jgi:AcrR family transcriptional regulator
VIGEKGGCHDLLHAWSLAARDSTGKLKTYSIQQRCTQLTNPVKPKRKYASTRRAEQAADTRATVIASAHQLFINGGWQGTTISGIARAAGVSSETIYAIFGNKQALLRAVLEHAVRRMEPDVPLLEQRVPKAIATATDQRSQIALFCKDITEVLGNVAELMAVVRVAAMSDSELAALYRDLHAGRRRNLAFVAKTISEHGPLRHGMNTDAATTLLWRLASPELFLLMTQVEEISPSAYAEWLEQTLTSALLP